MAVVYNLDAMREAVAVQQAEQHQIETRHELASWAARMMQGSTIRANVAFIDLVWPGKCYVAAVSVLHDCTKWMRRAFLCM